VFKNDDSYCAGTKKVVVTSQGKEFLKRKAFSVLEKTDIVCVLYVNTAQDIFVRKMPYLCDCLTWLIDCVHCQYGVCQSSS